jgi:valyl-tRNA synthetase
MSLYLFHEVANEIYHFIWHIYCDWYVEFAKSTFATEIKKSKETRDTSIWVFKEILIISHPVMPFITEKLWRLNFHKSNFLMKQLNIEIINQNNFLDSQKKFKNLIQIITSIRNLRSELNIPYKEKIFLDIKNQDLDFINFVKSFDREIIRLLKIDTLSFNDSNIVSHGSANIILSKTTLVIPLDGVIDSKQEIEKLMKKKNIELVELQKLESKLQNNNFISKAPKKVILQFKTQLADIKSSIDKIEQIMNTIK